MINHGADSRKCTFDHCGHNEPPPKKEPSVEKQPITITLRTAKLADQVKSAANEVGILNTRMEKPNDLAKDRI